MGENQIESHKTKKTEYIKNKAKGVKDTSVKAASNLVYSRILLVAFILIGQIYLLFVILSQVSASSAKWWLYVFNLCAAVFVVSIINSKDNPAYKMMWMIPLSVIPVFGVLLYLFIKANPVRWGQAKGLKKRIKETAPYLNQEDRIRWDMKLNSVPIADLSYYIEHVNGFPTYDGCEVTYYSDGEEKLVDLLSEIEKAEKFIFLEYFIINKGRVFDTILEALAKKAEEGVEVRLMYDGFNSFSLPFHYPKKLQQYGIKAKEFSPVVPFLSSHQNYRDHRKIVVIDGKVAFNGGINLADEYMNYIERFGYWKDTAIRIKGPAVKSFTAMFLQMWGMLSATEENYDLYLIDEESKAEEKAALGYVIPYNDDPCNQLDIAEEVYMDILNKAQDYVWITTPYLIPEHEMVTALCFAAQRGVDVRIVMPHIPDKKIAFNIAHTYYLQLIEAGVKIYEFMPGFVHAKMFLSDDCKAVVGTINLDYRSLYENFECATFIYQNPVIDDIKKDFLKTMDQCMEFQKEDYRKLSLLSRISGKIFRMFAPLM